MAGLSGVMMPVGRVPLPGTGYNARGQKLGAKGRSRWRQILAAAVTAIDEGEGLTMTLSSVARRAGLNPSATRAYFADLNDLLLAAIEAATAGADARFMDMLEKRWPDQHLTAHCYEFAWSYHEFWLSNAPFLHLRNSLADRRVARMMAFRIETTQPVIRGLARQMDAEKQPADDMASAMASVLITGLERTITVNTDLSLRRLLGVASGSPPERFLRPAARILEIGIADMRSAQRQPTSPDRQGHP